MIDVLISKIKEKQNPSVVGLDPKLSFVPGFIKEEMFERYGKTPKAAAECFYAFNQAIIDATADIVPAVKPQIAMYELYGADGIESYIKTVAYAKEKGLVVIGDIKRGDIASTAEAYSDTHIGRVDIDGQTYEIFKEDFITLNPYLGTDSVQPFIKNCRLYGKGLFMLVKTSNPSGSEIQDIESEGKPIYEIVAKLVEKWGLNLIGESGYSQIGAVVGATYPQQAKKIRNLVPNTFFLVPGYGAQGGTAQDMKNYFSEGITGAIINSSRGIIAAHQSAKYAERYTQEEFALCARQAAIDMKDEILNALS
ncbi:MAG: orotidine-5'-phosphate decarboxylase [Clostridiales bacterium]|jgi:orotidine-5'-phosphate decarboxylase|nr:orotidine-5'-phosphate decarboxylase [Clostridiales bacterium]